MGEVVEKVSPAAPEPTVSVIDATITSSRDPVATVTEERGKPIAAIEATKSSSTPAIKAMIKSTEDFVSLGQAKMEAFVKSGQIWAAGVQELMGLRVRLVPPAYVEPVVKRQKNDRERKLRHGRQDF